MAWFNSILGGSALPPPPPPPYASSLMNSTSSTSPLGNPYAAAQARGSIVAVNGASQPYFAADNQGAMYTVKNYTDAIGWTLTHHHLPAGVTSDDPKIAILKITTAGQVLKDVGVRTSDTDFYVMRDPNA